MITVVSPRIHNLGDFVNCLPALSGLHKATGEQIHFIICDRLQQFKGIKQLLSSQEMFSKVQFVNENPNVLDYILIDDTGSDDNPGNSPLSTVRYANFIRKHYNFTFDIDEDFELRVPKNVVIDTTNTIVVGDRWSLDLAKELDTRRYSNMIESSGIMKDKPAYYLDYTHDLVYNCNIIKQNTKPFVTTFTGIGIIADLMKKDSYILWGEDIRNWDNKPVEYSFERHYFKNRNAKLVYLNDFDVNKI
jgi:hypothetical protein